MQYVTKQLNKVAPIIEKAIDWAIRVMFESLKLAGLAYMVMHLINATFVVEVAIAAIIVFASLYFTARRR